MKTNNSHPPDPRQRPDTHERISGQDAILAMLKKHGNIKPQQIVALCKQEYGITVTASYAANMKSAHRPEWEGIQQASPTAHADQEPDWAMKLEVIGALQPLLTKWKVEGKPREAIKLAVESACISLF